MFIRYFIFVVSVFLAGGVYAKRLTPPYAIYVMPCQVISGTYASGFTVGTEFQVYKRFSLTLEGGPFYEPGYMAKGNIKYYLNGFKDGKMEIKKYFAIEYAYKEQNYTAHDELKTPPKPKIDYSVYKFTNTVNLKVGFVATRKHSYYMDAYVGLGIRYRIVQNDLTQAQVDDLYHWHEGFVDSYTNANARGFAPSVTIGWKIGFRYK
jgi:hypothetical protein